MPVLTLSENILLLICGLGILQGGVLGSIITFHSKGERVTGIFLALFIFFVSLVMTIPFFFHVVGWQHSFFIQPLPLVTGPLLYLYIRSFKERMTWTKVAPHFILFFLFFIPTYLNVSHFAAKYPGAKSLPTELLHSPATILLNYFKFGQSVVYFFLARKTLRSYQQSIRHLFEETKGFDLKWAKLLVNGYMMVVLSAIVAFAMMLRFPAHFSVLLLLTISISTPYVYAITYKGVLQRTIWQVHPGLSKEVVEKQIEEVEKSIPSRSGEKAVEVAGRIIELLEQTKIYQESNLTLQQLADKLQTPCYQVSQAFNEGMKKNFYDVINGYRVEEAKRLLLQPDSRNFTILSIGFEAGFNSKTTFNTVFKKFTGYTPTEFREKQRTRQAA